MHTDETYVYITYAFKTLSVCMCMYACTIKYCIIQCIEIRRSDGKLNLFLSATTS